LSEVDQLPAALEAEVYCMACLVAYPERAEEVFSRLAPTDFSDEVHREIFECFRQQHARGAIDIELARAELAAAGVDISGQIYGDLTADYLDELRSCAATTAHVPCKANEIIEARKKRQRYDELQTLAEHSLNGYSSEQIDRRLEGTLYDWKRECEATQPSFKSTFDDLEKAHPTLHAPIIESFGREGEIGNVISTSKAGKSWLVAYILLCALTGRYLFGRFKTWQGPCLLIDNELHKPTIVHRIHTVAAAMGISDSEWKPDLEVWSMRGCLRSFEDLSAEVREFEHGEKRIIAWDAKYRFAKPGENENDNSPEFYNIADQNGAATGALQLFVHHATKGSQSDKRVTDIGAGGGVQSRAADTHIVLREHEEPGVVVLEAAVRSFAPVDPVALRWQFPLWVPADDIDTSLLKGRLKPSEQRQNDQDREAISKIVDAIRKDGPGTARQLRGRTGISKERQQRLLDKMQADDQLVITQVNIRGNDCNEYSLPKSTDE
jgi:hypothetical protein